MLRHLTLFLLLCSVLLAQTFEGKRVQIMAENIDRNGSMITASGDVIVYDDTTILMANRVIYDMEYARLKLFGHVEMIKGLQYGALSDKVVIDLHRLHDTFEHPFLIDFSSELWLFGDKAQRDNDVITLKDALVSSCDVGCPDWYMQFTSLKYNRTTEWMDLWNPVLYMYNIPILYAPYIGFSTNRERRTGLLRPYVGISSRDGFFYNQPLFIAPDPQWDLEIIPQIRFNRGEGVFATLRFVDTPHSSGLLRTGYFYSKHSYVEAYNLKNGSHFGAQVNYQSRQLFTDEESQNHDGLYMDVTYLNDPDYLNLQARSTAGLLYSSQVQSRINYYFNTPENYVGIYGKYFIDTSLASNKETMQSIPVVQLHHYQNRLFHWNALHYAADYRVSNFCTGSGKQIQLQ